MINVKLTKNHKKSIKAYKRLFEKWDMWTFAFKQNEKYYFIASYKQRITGKVTAYLILDRNGNVPKFEEAKVPLYSLVLFNTKADNAGAEMVHQMNKSMKPYKDMYKSLRQTKIKFSMRTLNWNTLLMP